MPVNEDQLRQLLTERSDPARRRPVPEERIAIRIRRARLRRAAGAGVLAAAVVAGAVSGVVLAHQPAPGHVTSYSGQPLPASFTAADGAAYHRLAVTSVTGKAQRSASLTVTAGSAPIDVMAACDLPAGSTYLNVNVNGNLAGDLTCQGPSRLTGLFVHPGERLRITIVDPLPGGHLKAGSQFAAYSWAPPAIARPAPAEPRLPRNFTGPAPLTGKPGTHWHLVTSRSGDWPADKTVTITAPAGTSTLKLSLICKGAIAGRSWMSTTGYRSQPDLIGICQPWTPGQPVPGVLTIIRKDGKAFTITLHLRAPQANPAAYAKRTSSWTVALYAAQK